MGAQLAMLGNHMTSQQILKGQLLRGRYELHINL